MKKHLFMSGLLALSILGACNNPAERNNENIDLGADTAKSEEVNATEAEDNTQQSYEKDGLKLYPAPASVSYPDASLEMKAPKDNALITANDVNFDFEVMNYELGVQTADATNKGLANSEKGQHIHLIIDNGPYSAHYEPDFTSKIENGHHVGLAFLSRSYHESVKNANSYKVFQFTTGKSEGSNAKTDLSKPLLFYSRPKGEYKGADTKKVLLDFFLINVDLKVGGYAVRATINGSAFELNTWQPYIIEGLPMGENTITLELIDAAGNLAESDFNSVTRKFTLTE